MLVNTLCAICQTDQSDQEIYPANFSPDDLNVKTFSARRLPDRLHYRIVRCQRCGLVRSNPIINELTLSNLYTGSCCTYEQESLFAAQTYLSYFHRLRKWLGPQPKILEIGCGNGSFLKKLKENGVDDVYGVEPSRDAVEKSGELKSRITVGTFAEINLPLQPFDVICAFQVFDHISRPNEFLQKCRSILKPKGLVLFINHDIRAWTARLLKESCPMIDIEHTYLYDRKTFQRIFEKNQFEVLDIFSTTNCYPLSYWLKLMPAPRRLKQNLLTRASRSKWGNLAFSMSLGNMGLIAHAQSQ